MKYYAPQHKQLTLDLVRSSLDNLDKSNRWVQMGDNLPWPDIEKEYNSKHKGVLKIDATCADAEVRYPVDSTLLETACRKIDEYASKVCKEFGVTGKKTHYKDVRRSCGVPTRACHRWSILSFSCVSLKN